MDTSTNTKTKTTYASHDEIMRAIAGKESEFEALDKAKTITFGRLTKAYEFILILSPKFKNGLVEARLKQMKAEGADQGGIRGKQPVKVGDSQERKIQRTKNKSGKPLPPTISIPLHTLVRDEDEKVKVEFKANEIVIYRANHK